MDKSVALEIAKTDVPNKCNSCDVFIDDDKDYCFECGSYWEDVDNGMFDEHYEFTDEHYYWGNMTPKPDNK